MAESKNHKSVRTGGRWLQGLGCFGTERHKGFLFVSLYPYFPCFLSLVLPLSSLVTVEEESFYEICCHNTLLIIHVIDYSSWLCQCFWKYLLIAQVPHTTPALVQEVLEAKPSGAKSLKKKYQHRQWCMILFQRDRLKYSWKHNVWFKILQNVQRIVG